MKKFILAATLSVFAAPAFAEVGDKLQDDGKLNAHTLSLEYFATEYDFKKGDSIACAYGYAASKMARHDWSQAIFDKCMAAGVDAAYPWKSYMAQNGFGTEKSIEAAADWDKKSAERGYKIGEFNYGIDLLRGYGVKQDLAEGKRLIDVAAAKGLDWAIEVQKSGYDPMVAIPDADKPRIY